MGDAIRVLAWSDAVLAATGYGTVARHVLWHLHQTGRYQIDQLAINYGGEPYDRQQYPYQLIPAKLANPADPAGRAQLLQMLERGSYDILWVLMDAGFLQQFAGELHALRERKRAAGARAFRIIFYFPVDGEIFPDETAMIRLADVPVAYTEFGRRMTVARAPEVAGRLAVIPHGSDVQTFRSLASDVRLRLREQFGVSDPRTFLLVNVNMNFPRKDLPRCIQAFAQFKERVPNSVLYLHTEPRRSPFNLFRCCMSAGLTPADVRFAELPPEGFPIGIMNNVYNVADAFFTTTLGEGWGLTINEAMCAGVPVIAPNNSSIPELLGTDGDRGYVYDCPDRLWVDNGGYRPVGRVDQIVAKLHECHDQRGTPRQQAIITRASEFTRRHTWESVCKQWVTVFEAEVAKSRE